MAVTGSSAELFTSAVESLTTRWHIPAPDAAAAMLSAAQSRNLPVADLAAFVVAADDQRRLTSATTS